MAESREVQALQKISAEVDESQIKIICSTQCIKAQAYLATKLKKEAARLREAYSYIARANYKLQSEIGQAEQDIKSLRIAQETIRIANVELKKELLLTKDKKIEITERVNNGEKKYEEIWLQSKTRYESLSFVQNLLKAKNEVEIIEKQITTLDNEKKILIENIKAKTNICFDLDRKRIVGLADFIVNEMPKYLIIINEKSTAINDLTNTLNNLNLLARVDIENRKIVQQIREEANISKCRQKETIDNTDNSSFMPKLQLSSMDFDSLSVKLDQAKIKASNKSPINNTTDAISYIKIDSDKINKNFDNREEYDTFFNMSSVVYEDNKNKNYAKMKLINILEDIKIDTNQAFNIVAQVNPNTLHTVKTISANDKNTAENVVEVNKIQANNNLSEDEIEDVDMTPKSGQLLVPPTQFLDDKFEQVSNKEAQENANNLDVSSKYEEKQILSQALQGSQEQLINKKVSFALEKSLEPNISQDNKCTEVLKENNDNSINDEPNIQLNVSAEASDEGFSKIKDMIIKKHDLDLTPPFVYAKNVKAPMNLQHTRDTVIRSKFFQDQPRKQENIGLVNEKVKTVCKITEFSNNTDISYANYKEDDNIVSKDFDADIIPGPKRQKMNELIPLEKPVSGFPFSYDAPYPESLDASLNTTGFEYGDQDYPQCIDSSLLLSPKADIPMPNISEAPEIPTQDVPNFLSGIRKAGLSFFGQSSEPKPGTSGQNQGSGGFTFNFGGEEKKGRGGLFSMFQ